MTKEDFLTVRWNNLLSLGLGIPALIIVVFALLFLISACTAAGSPTDDSVDVTAALAEEVTSAESNDVIESSVQTDTPAAPEDTPTAEAENTATPEPEDTPAAEPTQRPVTIVTQTDFSSEPYQGTFELAEGAGILGCSEGTFVDTNTGAAIHKVLTCVTGEKTGTFTVEFIPWDPGRPWCVVDVSGEFSELTGTGNFSEVQNPAEESAVGTFAGEMEYTAEEKPPCGAEQQFSTDFSIHTVPYSEISTGGPPKDGIPAIDNPQFVSVVEADQWVEDLEPVTVFEENGDVRIYPYQILTWHEIANDIVGGRPVAVTFCPLCNSAMIFDATVNGMQLDFGTTGHLRFNNLIMYDRQTESWWQQAGGDAIAGELTGERLTFLPASTLSWSEARDAFPDAKVLSRDTGGDVLPDGTPYTDLYGINPYAGYDNINESPFLYDGPTTPGDLPPMARVTTVELNGEAVAYPNDTLIEVGVINDTIGGTDVVVFWQSGVASALDTEILADGRDVGTSGVFERTLAGQTLTFVSDGNTITDEQTGSTWNILGQATDGELTGEELTPVVKVDHFWFSWAAFQPDTRIYQR